MKRSNRLVLLVGIFLAVVAFILVLILFQQQDSTPDGGQPVTTTNIVLAARDFPAGTKMAADDLTTKEVAIAEKPANAVSEPAVFIGQTARVAVTEGQLMTTEVFNPNSGVVKVLEVPAGKVAMSVKVDQVSGVGTVIKPGDYVDAVVAFNIQPGTINEDTGAFTPLGEPGTSVKALLQGMQVLGTLLPPVTQDPNASPQPGGGNQTAFNDQQQIVILAVDLQQAEVLNYAQVKGIVGPNGITLVLRSLKDFQDASGQPSIPPNTVTTGMILSILIEQYGVLVPGFEGQTVPSPAP